MLKSSRMAITKIITLIIINLQTNFVDINFIIQEWRKFRSCRESAFNIMMELRCNPIISAFPSPLIAETSLIFSNWYCYWFVLKNKYDFYMYMFNNKHSTASGVFSMTLAMFAMNFKSAWVNSRAFFSCSLRISNLDSVS